MLNCIIFQGFQSKQLPDNQRPATVFYPYSLIPIFGGDLRAPPNTLPYPTSVVIRTYSGSI